MAAAVESAGGELLHKSLTVEESKIGVHADI
jgi:hypothetical protein